MISSKFEFDVSKSLHKLKHYLPAQAALKDFVHHNTLHAFQEENFFEALWKSSHIFGYSTYLSIDEFRSYYKSEKINTKVLDHVLHLHLEKNELNPLEFEAWKENLLFTEYNQPLTSRIGQLSSLWKNIYGMNMDKMVHPTLFRFLSAFLDQGISTWKFPITHKNFIQSLRELEENNIVSLFKSKRVRKLLLDPSVTIEDLLFILVGNEELYEHYLFDQQFAHPGWSGFVSVVESQPETLLSYRKISLKCIVHFETLLEIDALDTKFPNGWDPISKQILPEIVPIFSPVKTSNLTAILEIWQQAFEWSYFDSVLFGLTNQNNLVEKTTPSFQGLFCIDDREYSFRRRIEDVDTNSETFGTPGFFGVEFFFQPEDGKFHTKACPAPMTPQYLIKESSRKKSHRKDIHYSKHSSSLVGGWIISGTIGFWSALKLFFNIFKPQISPATAYSFMHMDKHSKLKIESEGQIEDGLHVGFTIDEMALRVKNVLKSIGLTSNFSPIVYIVGHGGSSVNNPYYAGYDCGACCGRPGAVNARVFAHMANKTQVRQILESEGINIPKTTLFIGAMHDTTRDEIEYYDDKIKSEFWHELHVKNQIVFAKALELNAVERSLRFDTMSKGISRKRIHKQVKNRSVALFEPRPEWNHTDNALCLIGRKIFYNHLFLDKRPFINSYDYSQDQDGKYLLGILNAAIPVCGGINLEYYFSRVDQQKLGSGTKLPHNVVGLFAVSNGIDGDLRSGLPSQMVEIHDAVRILFVVEHFPEIVLKVLQSNPSIYEWVRNQWVLFGVKNPETDTIYLFENDAFVEYIPITNSLPEFSKYSKTLRKLYKNQPLLKN
jgi:hypothetical protein